MLVESDHDLSQDKNQGGIDDEGELETVFPKIVDEALEELQDDEEGKEAGYRKAKGLLEIISGHDFPDFPEQSKKPYPQDKHDEEDQELKEQIHDPIEESQGLKVLPKLA